MKLSRRSDVDGSKAAPAIRTVHLVLEIAGRSPVAAFEAKDLDYTSPVSRKPLTRATEKNYYFRLSAYQKPLEEFFAKNPEFVRPEGRRNEVLGRLRESSETNKA